MSKKGYHNITFRIKSNHNEQLEGLSKYAKDKYGVFISKTTLVRIALDKLFENEDFDKILDEYKLI